MQHLEGLLLYIKLTRQIYFVPTPLLQEHCVGAVEYIITSSGTFVTMCIKSIKRFYFLDLSIFLLCYQCINLNHNSSPVEPCGSPRHEWTLSTSISMAKEPCLWMFFLPSFIKPALCFSLIVSGHAEHPDKHYQHPSM